MQNLPSFDNNPDLLVGPSGFSDAGVFRVRDDLAIVQTVDFFPPLVDDSFIFGQIAAANSLSDVYAMGGKPMMTLNIVGFPDDQLPMDILEKILAGGAERIQAAGAALLGGHSVRDVEIKYGLAVTGSVHPDEIITNAGARPGDVLILTKAIGTGFVTTANRAGKCSSEVLDAAIASMIQLNDVASKVARQFNAHAATDITGFGLAGHGREMADASGVTLQIELASLPILPGAIDAAKAGHVTRANGATREFLKSKMQFAETADRFLQQFLFDPQTSGGLLIAVDAEQADDCVSALHQGNIKAATKVGSVVERQGDCSIHIVS